MFKCHKCVEDDNCANTIRDCQISTLSQKFAHLFNAKVALKHRVRFSEGVYVTWTDNDTFRSSFSESKVHAMLRWAFWYVEEMIDGPFLKFNDNDVKKMKKYVSLEMESD